MVTVVFLDDEIACIFIFNTRLYYRGNVLKNKSIKLPPFSQKKRRV